MVIELVFVFVVFSDSGPQNKRFSGPKFNQIDESAYQRRREGTGERNFRSIESKNFI